MFGLLIAEFSHSVAVVRVRDGLSAPTLTEVGAHLAVAGLARQKVPEFLYVVSELPRTPPAKFRSSGSASRSAAGYSPQDQEKSDATLHISSPTGCL